MGYGTESSLFGIVAAVLGIVLILTVVLRMWKKVPQDKAGVVTGMKKRVITGGGGLVIPVFERIDYISLGNIPLSVWHAARAAGGRGDLFAGFPRAARRRCTGYGSKRRPAGHSDPSGDLSRQRSVFRLCPRAV